MLTFPCFRDAQGGRDAYRGVAPGSGSGEGPSAGVAPRHTVKIYNRAAGQEVEVEVPEDRCAAIALDTSLFQVSDHAIDCRPRDATQQSRHCEPAQ